MYVCLSILLGYDGRAHNSEEAATECNNFLTHSMIHYTKVAFMKVTVCSESYLTFGGAVKRIGKHTSWFGGISMRL